MVAAVKAHSFEKAAERASKKPRVIPLEEPTTPPAVEDFHRLSWFVVFTLPGQEWRAMESLQQAGFCPFLPVRARWNGLRFRTKRAVEFPLLVRYLFVGAAGSRLSDKDRAAIRYADGVKAVLGSHHEGCTIPLRVPVENLVQLAGEIVAGDYDETRDVWGDGDDVVITSGPFRTFAAKVGESVPSTTAPDDPVQVLLKILGRDTIMHIPLADLERAR